MTRTYVNQLTDGQSIDEIFLASEKQLRPNRAGHLYLQVRVSDKTGSLTAMLWNASQRVFDRFENGDYVRVKGAAQLYNGGMQVILKDVAVAEPSHVDEAEFTTLSTKTVEDMVGQLAEQLRLLDNIHLRNLVEVFLSDEAFMNKFKRAPAGIKNHHAYQGGLLEHVISLVTLAQLVGGHYQRVDQDLLVMGAFLHDLGKTDELAYERDLAYRDAGQLLGHMSMGVELLHEKIKQAEVLSGEPFPEMLAVHLKHMVLSHHGELQYGSPVLPMTLEAIALHFIDNLDAKMHGVAQIIDEDANLSSPWTTYQPSLSRKIFKDPLARRTSD